MLNTYEIQVRARCPVNPEETDVYHFAIESQSMIKVEDITGFFKAHAREVEIFQERLTGQCATALGAKVTSIGWHSGVKVTCCAP